MRPAQPPIGSKIKRARERLRLTQQQLAGTLGVSQKTIDNWENDRRYPKSAIGALEEALGVSFDVDEPAAPGPDELDEEIDAAIRALTRLRERRDQRPGKGSDGDARYAI